MLFIIVYLCIYASISGLCFGNVQSNTAAIPTRKNRNTIANLFRKSFVTRLLREAKTSFCSELESLTLQLTRPTSEAAPLSLIDDLTTFVSMDYNDQVTMTNLLIKFSRKLAEPDAYTILKSLVSIHLLMERLPAEPQLVLSSLFNALSSEQDDKTNVLFFCEENIETAAKYAGTAAELISIDFARKYSSYLKKYMRVKNSDIDNETTVQSKGKETALNILQKLGEEAVISSHRTENPLSTQCRAAIEKDRAWIKQKLQDIKKIGTTKYNSNANSDSKLSQVVKISTTQSPSHPVATISTTEDAKHQHTKADSKSAPVLSTSTKKSALLKKGVAVSPISTKSLASKKTRSGTSNSNNRRLGIVVEEDE